MLLANLEGVLRALLVQMRLTDPPIDEREAWTARVDVALRALDTGFAVVP